MGKLLPPGTGSSGLAARLQSSSGSWNVVLACNRSLLVYAGKFMRMRFNMVLGSAAHKGCGVAVALLPLAPRHLS